MNIAGVKLPLEEPGSVLPVLMGARAVEPGPFGSSNMFLSTLSGAVEKLLAGAYQTPAQPDHAASRPIANLPPAQPAPGEKTSIQTAEPKDKAPVIDHRADSNIVATPSSLVSTLPAALPDLAAVQIAADSTDGGATSHASTGQSAGSLPAVSWSDLQNVALRAQSPVAFGLELIANSARPVQEDSACRPNLSALENPAHVAAPAPQLASVGPVGSDAPAVTHAIASAAPVSRDPQPPAASQQVSSPVVVSPDDSPANPELGLSSPGSAPVLSSGSSAGLVPLSATFRATPCRAESTSRPIAAAEFHAAPSGAISTVVFPNTGSVRASASELSGGASSASTMNPRPDREASPPVISGLSGTRPSAQDSTASSPYKNTEPRSPVDVPDSAQAAAAPWPGQNVLLRSAARVPEGAPDAAAPLSKRNAPLLSSAGRVQESAQDSTASSLDRNVLPRGSAVRVQGKESDLLATPDTLALDTFGLAHILSMLASNTDGTHAGAAGAVASEQESRSIPAPGPVALAVPGIRISARPTTPGTTAAQVPDVEPAPSELPPSAMTQATVAPESDSGNLMPGNAMPSWAGPSFSWPRVQTPVAKRAAGPRSADPSSAVPPLAAGERGASAQGASFAVRSGQAARALFSQSAPLVSGIWMNQIASPEYVSELPKVQPPAPAETGWQEKASTAASDLAPAPGEPQEAPTGARKPSALSSLSESSSKPSGSPRTEDKSWNGLARESASAPNASTSEKASEPAQSGRDPRAQESHRKETFSAAVDKAQPEAVQSGDAHPRVSAGVLPWTGEIAPRNAGNGRPEATEPAPGAPKLVGPEAGLEPAAAPAAAKQISLQLAGAANVAVQVRERAGRIEVAVRSGDGQLTKSLQSGLGELVTRLEGQGFKTQAWTPAAAREAAARPSSGETAAGSPQQGHSNANQHRQTQDQANQRRPHRPSRGFQQTLADEDARRK